MSENKPFWMVDALGPRDDRGIVVSLKVEGDQVRIIFDDVVSEGEDQPPRRWRHVVLYTSTHFARQSFEANELSDEQLASIGLAVIARLAAIEATRTST
jgi:hypothetical protein